jgi:hypothetical protein
MRFDPMIKLPAVALFAVLALGLACKSESPGFGTGGRDGGGGGAGGANADAGGTGGAVDSGGASDAAKDVGADATLMDGGAGDADPRCPTTEPVTDSSCPFTSLGALCLYPNNIKCVCNASNDAGTAGRWLCF